MSIGRSTRRVLIVCTTATVCGAWLAGPAAAASTDSKDLLGLGGLVSSLTQPQQSVAAPHSPATSNSSLADTLDGLPILGAVLKPVVDSLPLLGSGTHSTPAKPTAPAPAANIANRIPTTQLGASGSTWTMSVPPADSTPQTTKPSGGGHDGGGGGGILPTLPNLLNAASKAEVGAAAAALIILGGVAVAGAAGAAGAAGRRQFIGGPW